MIHPDTFNVVEFSGAKGLVFIGEKFIVYRRDDTTKNSPGLLDLPGGGREGGETPFETFKREVKEEFGVTISENDILASYRKDSMVNLGTKSFFIVTKPLGITVKDIVFGNEGTEWMLMVPEEFIQRSDGIERQQKRVGKYLMGNMVSE